MLSKIGIIFGVVSILGFFTGVGVGFIVFWYQFKVRLLNLFIANYDLIDCINELSSDEEYDEKIDDTEDEENCEDD